MVRGSKAGKIWTHVWVHALVWMFVLFSIFPILQIVGISLRPGDQLYSTDLKIIPDNHTFAAFRIILTEKPFLFFLVHGNHLPLHAGLQFLPDPYHCDAKPSRAPSHGGRNSLQCPALEIVHVNKLPGESLESLYAFAQFLQLFYEFHEQE